MRMYEKRRKGYQAIGYVIQIGNENPSHQLNEYEYLRNGDL